MTLSYHLMRYICIAVIINFTRLHFSFFHFSAISLFLFTLVPRFIVFIHPGYKAILVIFLCNYLLCEYMDVILDNLLFCTQLLDVKNSFFLVLTRSSLVLYPLPSISIFFKFLKFFFCKMISINSLDFFWYSTKTYNVHHYLSNSFLCSIHPNL